MGGWGCVHLVVLISPKKHGRFPKHLKIKSKASLQPLETCHFLSARGCFLIFKGPFLSLSADHFGRLSSIMSRPILEVSICLRLKK